MTGFRRGSQICRCISDHHKTRLVAVTGGPGAGKTAVLEMALRSFCDHVGLIPEAASVLFGGGFPRHDGAVALRHIQRAIFGVQREMEGMTVALGNAAVSLCDRGTLDGAAYWPDSVESFWTEMQTTREVQLNRYHAVLHLRTPTVDQGYNHQNTLRVETSSEAQLIDQRILEAWDGHPNRLMIASTDDFIEKAALALSFLRSQLPDCCREHRVPGEQS